ncbi:MAG TPA: hypothetical protein VFE40_03765 [Jatrophihabitantaceae bacterium]|jgi:hypothetical protein|nr:hypothetical protein [Jatrophihabitantaceae bacterium]
MTRIRLLRKPYAVIAVGAALLCYVLVMVLWVGGSPAGPPDSFNANGAPPTNLSTPPPASPAKASASPPSRTPARPGLTGLLPKQLAQAFPASSTDADHSGLPIRSVRIEVTSDAVIAGIGYLIANGKPPSYDGYWFKSPFIVNTVARSGGLTSFVAAQAGPTASRITCTLIVDGKLAMRRTAHGPHKVVTCLG